MDPLSITASTVALVEFGLKLVKGLEILWDISHIRDDIAALIDELRDLHDVLTAVCVATKQSAGVEGLRERSDELKPLLLKAENILRCIGQHCGISVTHLHRPNSEDPARAVEPPLNLDLLTRFRWLKNRKRIDLYRQRLKTIRLDILNHLVSSSLWVWIESIIVKY